MTVTMLLAVICGSAARATEEPLFELGAGVGAVAFEDYRGSNVTHAYPLPVPYLRYRGEFLRADRDGVRGRLFDQDWVELNVSGNATTPVRTDRARSGMPGLKSTLELGPSVDFHLVRSDDRRLRVDLKLPIRAAFTLQSPPESIGWTFSPRLALDVRDPFGFAGWNAGIQAGPLFAARRYDAYFYSVTAPFATLTRPAFASGGGYAGAAALFALSKRFRHYWVGAYLRTDTLAGASFAASPLVERQSYWSGGIGIAWILHTSAQRVEVAD